MLLMRAYRHKLLFTPDQEGQAARFAGCARLIYNAGLQQRIMGYEIYKRGISYTEHTSHLPAAKKAEGFEFLQEVPAHVLQQSLRNLDVAFQRFFQGHAAYPTFKKRGQGDSFRFPDPDPKQIGAHHPDRQGQVRLPKLGWVKVRNCYPKLGTQLFEGTLKFITVVKEHDGWYASFTCQVQIPDPVQPQGAPVGLDLGVVNSVATSDGELISLPTATEREQEKLTVLQRRVSSKELGSRNRAKAQRQLNLFRQGIRNRQKDAQHKLSTYLAKTHSRIIVEELNIKKMTKAEGKAKKDLNRGILGQSWGELIRQLGYKTEWYGSQLVKVNPAYTSQTCSECGHCSEENRENQADFSCVSCGHAEHADLNAATNILLIGTDGTSALPTGDNAWEVAPLEQPCSPGRPSREVRLGAKVLP